MKYAIQTNDGRWVTQEGTAPVLTRAKALRYVWPTKEEAEQMLEKYALFFQASSEQNRRTGVLALAVMRLDEEPPTKSNLCQCGAIMHLPESIETGRCAECREKAKRAAKPDDRLYDWRYDVANGDTLLGYQEWCEHNPE